MENCFSVAVPSSTLHSSRWSAGCAFSSEKYFDLVCFLFFFPLSKRNIAENGVIHRSCWDTYQKSDIFYWVVSGESDEQEMSECYFASHEVSGLISAQADVSWAHETLRSPGALFFPAAHEGWWGFWVVFWPLSVPAAWTWPFKDFSSWLCWWSLMCHALAFAATWSTLSTPSLDWTVLCVIADWDVVKAHNSGRSS